MKNNYTPARLSVILGWRFLMAVQWNEAAAFSMPRFVGNVINRFCNISTYVLPGRLGPARLYSIRFGVDLGCNLGPGFEVVFGAVLELHFEIDFGSISGSMF